MTLTAAEFQNLLEQPRPSSLRQIRNYLATTSMALYGCFFFTHLRLFFLYVQTSPRHAVPGFINQLNNHGSIYYIRDVEALGLRLLWWGMFASFFFGMVIVPKELILPPADTPRWVTKVSVSFKTDLQKPTRRLWFVFIISIAMWTGVIYFGGKHIVALALAAGITP